MKRVLINKLTEGMIVAEDVRLNPKQIFIKAGTRLTATLIQKLYHTNLVFIKIEKTSIPNSKEEIGEEIEPLEMSHLQQVIHSEEFLTFKAHYKLTIKSLADLMTQIVYEDTIPDLNVFIYELWSLCEDKGQYFSVLDYLLALREFDDTTYGHCINVALICSVFADWLNFSKQDRDTAIFCGLFHDIGKLKIPVEIIRKPAKLTIAEYDEIKKHAVFGYEILSHHELNTFMGDHVRNAALMHHERCDGSGYPFGLRGDKLDRFSKMVAIVDVFDAMTSTRVYRKAICPFKVLSHFERIGYQKFDAQMLMVFLEHMTSRYMNCNVRLNNGNVGKIVFLNKVNLSKPMIRCGEKYIDLANETELFIESVF